MRELYWALLTQEYWARKREYICWADELRRAQLSAAASAGVRERQKNSSKKTAVLAKIAALTGQGKSIKNEIQRVAAFAKCTERYVRKILAETKKEQS